MWAWFPSLWRLSRRWKSQILIALATAVEQKGIYTFLLVHNNHLTLIFEKGTFVIEDRALKLSPVYFSLVQCYSFLGVLTYISKLLTFHSIPYIQRRGKDLNNAILMFLLFVKVLWSKCHLPYYNQRYRSITSLSENSR